MSELKFFENSSFGSVRIIMRGDKPWFVAADVCRCLDIRVCDAMPSLEDYEKQLLTGEQFSETQSLCTPDSIGGASNADSGVSLVCPPSGVNIISESGLYSLAMRSRKPEAKAFKRWVCEEVLPSIRETGMYVMPNFKDPIEAAEAWLKAEKAKRKAQAALVQEQAARAEIQQQLNKQIAVTDKLLVRLGLAGSYLQVKGFPYIHRIALELPKDANQRFWGPIGKAVSAICRSHGGVELSPQKVATTWGQFENRGPWDMVQFPDPQYTTIHVYPVCAMEEFKQLLISGFYDTYKFAQYLHNDFKTILSAI